MYLNNHMGNNDSYGESRCRSVLSLILNFVVSKRFHSTIHPRRKSGTTDGNGGHCGDSRKISERQGSEGTTTVQTESYSEYLLESIFGGRTGSEKQKSRTTADACYWNREARGKRNTKNYCKRSIE